MKGLVLPAWIVLPGTGVGDLWPWVRSDPGPVSLNKVLLEHGHTPSFTPYLRPILHYNSGVE